MRSGDVVMCWGMSEADDQTSEDEQYQPRQCCKYQDSSQCSHDGGVETVLYSLQCLRCCHLMVDNNRY